MEDLTALLETLPPAQREVVDKVKGALAKADTKIKRLEIEVEHQRLLILELRRSRYGAKGEKLSTLQLNLLVSTPDNALGCSDGYFATRNAEDEPPPTRLPGVE